MLTRLLSLARHGMMLALVLLLTNCSWTKESRYTPSEAEIKLAAFCQKESQLTIATRFVGKTLWVYAALDEPLFSVKPSPASNRAEKTPAPFGLLYIDTQFTEEKNFALTYDIVKDVLPADPVTYGSAYNENYTKKRQVIYQGLQESIFNVETDKEPTFIVIVLADITTGVATKSTFTLKDLKGYMSEALPMDEYYLREANVIFGDKALMGDKNGFSLTYTDIAWSDFLSEQINNRVRFRFTQSDFQPKAEPDKIILEIAANTLRFYPFTDYTGVTLNNLRDKKENSFSKEELKSFEEEKFWEKSAGRLTTIHFNAGNLFTNGSKSDDNKEENK